MDPIVAILAWAFDVYRDLKCEDEAEWLLEFEPQKIENEPPDTWKLKAAYRSTNGEYITFDKIEIIAFSDGRIRALLSPAKARPSCLSRYLLGASFDLAKTSIAWPMETVCVSAATCLPHPPSFFCEPATGERLRSEWLAHIDDFPAPGPLDWDDILSAEDVEVPDTPEAAEEDARQAGRDNDYDQGPEL